MGGECLAVWPSATRSFCFEPLKAQLSKGNSWAERDAPSKVTLAYKSYDTVENTIKEKGREELE